MSGCVGAPKIEGRQNYEAIFNSYLNFIKEYPNLVSVRSSGSYISNKTKTSFGDMDLIIEVKGFNDKKLAKLDFVDWIMKQPEEFIVPFCSEKYNGRTYLNTGEIVTIGFQSTDKSIPFSQIDNIFALTEEEASFKENFLNMPAAKQGIIMGLVKIFVDYFGIDELYKRLNINPYKFEQKNNFKISTNLSSSFLSIREDLYYDDSYTSKIRNVIWESINWNDVTQLLIEFDLNESFEDLVYKINDKILCDTTKRRIFGVLASMVSVKSGEIGTPKGLEKEKDIEFANFILNNKYIH